MSKISFTERTKELHQPNEEKQMATPQKKRSPQKETTVGSRNFLKGFQL